MKIEFLQVSSRHQAKRKAPWAARIVKVEGGFMAFESYSDYEAWRGQK